MSTHDLSQEKKQRPLLTSHITASGNGTKDEGITFIPGAVLPEQFFDQSQGTARTSGHVALLRAVLTDAIECYQRQYLANGRYIPRLAKEAQDWLFSNDERWPFAFVNVCAALGMEPDAVRSGLRARRQSPEKAKQKLRRSAPVRRSPCIVA